MEIRRLDSIGLLLISMALWLGCGGDSSGRYAITGTVTLDGAPIDKGNISFQPMEGAKTSSGAMVNAGSFSIPKNKGLLPGKYRVEVYAAAPGGGGQQTRTHRLARARRRRRNWFRRSGTKRVNRRLM